jgi:hypothetical protein
LEAEDILALPMTANDANAETVGAYLKALLIGVLTETEGFSGKRPFGNSGWIWDLYRPLVVAGLITGTLDEDGYIEKCDDKAALALILGAIRSM